AAMEVWAPALQRTATRCAASGARRSLHRRIHQVAHQRAGVLALAGALHHEDRKEVFLRVDPEERAGHAAPEELAGRAWEWRDAGLGAHRKAEAEAMAGRHQLALDLHVRSEVIGRHPLQRLAADHPDAVERTAIH